jgi:hypothetical protein
MIGTVIKTGRMSKLPLDEYHYYFEGKLLRNLKKIPKNTLISVIQTKKPKYKYWVNFKYWGDILSCKFNSMRELYNSISKLYYPYNQRKYVLTLDNGKVVLGVKDLTPYPLNPDICHVN